MVKRKKEGIIMYNFLQTSNARAGLALSTTKAALKTHSAILQA